MPVVEAKSPDTRGVSGIAWGPLSCHREGARVVAADIRPRRPHAGQRFGTSSLHPLRVTVSRHRCRVGWRHRISAGSTSCYNAGISDAMEHR